MKTKSFWAAVGSRIFGRNVLTGTENPRYGVVRLPCPITDSLAGTILVERFCIIGFKIKMRIIRTSEVMGWHGKDACELPTTIFL
ncbi:hypothetical protein OOT00_07340 [Desulfobotulus sp. H1]|uniref:Uncharacterized protein n=1 Tax=Desulfobotulus pelophilus TaxID=2823377 RepID=A0ABT3N8M6_9BACT|nr:hypothetical protein [Desulfobotulus pelophilus]MCW7753794.1 hypothetical protein [Desulfobotulus pelophilus]